MYINDITKYLTDSKASLYADDTALYCNADTQVELMLTLRVELDMVCEWLKANKLTLNAAKTKYVVFGTKRKLQTKPDLKLKMGDCSIERVTTMKYLGVMLDDHLTFNDHIDYAHNKASKKLGILRKSREYLDQSTSLLLYKSLVLPHLDYCDLVYMCTTLHNLNRLQLVQNQACRTILMAPKETSTQNMHKQLELPLLAQRRQLHLSTECYKNATNDEAGLHGMFVKTANRGRQTRQSEGG